MLRIIILTVVGYLLYRAVRSWMFKQMPPTAGPDEHGSTMPVDDVMVKDPNCGVYFPKREGIRLKQNGEELYFCSHKCRDEYLTDKSQ